MPLPDRWKSTRADLWVLVLLFLLVLWTFRSILAGAHDPFINSLRDFEPWKSNLTAADAARHESFAMDPVTQTYPWAVYSHEHLSKGDFPLWNIRMFSGTPFIANRLTGLFDPLILLPVWLCSPVVGLSIFYFLHYLLAAWFMYLFLKSLGLSRPAALFGAVAYIYQGAYVPWMGFIVADKAYLPMLLYYLSRTCDRGDRAGIVGFIVSVTLLTITSYPQMSVFVVYIVAAWVLFTRGPGFRAAARRGLGLILMLVLAFLLGAMQHLPMMEFFSLSLRAEPEFREELASLTKLEQHDSPLAFVAIFFPRVFGDYLTDPVSPLPEKALRIYNHAYIGIIAAFGFLLAPMVWRNRYARFFTIMALLGLLFIAWDQVYMFAARILPGFRISTVKPDFLALTSMIIVASFVLDHLLRNLRLDTALGRRFERGYAWLMEVILVMAFVMIVAHVIPGLLSPALFTRYSGVFVGMIILWLAGALLYLHLRRGLAMKWVVAGLVVLELIDLVPYHEHLMPLIPRGRTGFRTESIEFIEEGMAAEGPFRIFRDRRIVMGPNSPMLFGFDEIGGFDSFISADYAHFFRRIDPLMSRNSRTIDLPRKYEDYLQPFWSFLGIRYLLLDRELPFLPPQWQLVWTRDLYVYENTDWLPRWFLVPRIIPMETVEEGWDAALAIDPRREAVVVDIEHADIPPALLEGPFEDPIGTLQHDFYGADELLLTADCERDCFLVFSDTYFPGWRAWVDGEEVRVYRTDGIIKGIVVPAGTYSVRFLYDPPLYKWGWLLVLIGAILTPFLIRPIRLLFREAPLGAASADG